MCALAADHLGIKGAVVRAFRFCIGRNFLHAFRVPALFAKPTDLIAIAAN
jgi:hypothetical protein